MEKSEMASQIRTRMIGEEGAEPADVNALSDDEAIRHHLRCFEASRGWCIEGDGLLDIAIARSNSLDDLFGQLDSLNPTGEWY